MNIINRLVFQFPKVIIGIIILLTGFFGYQAFDIGINTDIKDMFPQDDPAVAVFDSVSEKYGGSEMIILMLGDENIIDLQSLRNIDTLTRRFGKIEGINQVRSITNIEEIRGEGMTIEVGEFIQDLPKNTSEVDSVRKRLLKHERYLGTLVSEDLQYATIIAQLNSDADQKTVVAQIKEVRRNVQLTEQNYLTGSPVLTKELADNMQQDITRLLPFVSLVVMMILFISFRSGRGVLLPLIIVLISVIWTIGFSAWIGQNLSIVSTALPVLLVSVGSAYAIHYLARYYEDQFKGFSREHTILESTKNVGLAIVMAGVTTMAGFSSLGFSDLTILRDFGLLVAFGVGVALLVSITFLPALLLQIKQAKAFHSAQKRKYLDHLFSWINRTVQQRSSVIIIPVVLVTVLSAVVIPRIQPETNYITFFPVKSEVRQANDLVNKNFGGSSAIEIIVNTGKTNGIENPEVLRQIKQFQEEAEQIHQLSHAMSIVDLLEEENKALHSGQQEYNTLPEHGIAQYLLLLESDDDEIIDDFIDFDHREARIRIMTSSTESQSTERILNELRNLTDKYFHKQNIKVTITGVPVLSDKLQSLIISSQIRSLISAILFAFIVTSLLLKSPIKGLACSIPIAVTVLVNFGIMGWTSVPLDAATSMIASVAVGIGIDYAIHLYTRYQEGIDEGMSVQNALEESIHTVGRANYFNAIAVTSGFLVLLFSNFPPLRTFGLLTSVTMLLSLAGAMLLLPALIRFKELAQNQILNSQR